MGQALGNLGVALSISQPLGDVILVLTIQQAGSQHLPQILVKPLRVGEKKFRDMTVLLILPQQPLKVFPRLQAADGVGQRGVQELDVPTVQGGDGVLLALQIDRITHAIGWGRQRAGLSAGGGCRLTGRNYLGLLWPRLLFRRCRQRCIGIL